MHVVVHSNQDGFSNLLTPKSVDFEVVSGSNRTSLSEEIRFSYEASQNPGKCSREPRETCTKALVGWWWLWWVVVKLCVSGKSPQGFSRGLGSAVYHHCDLTHNQTLLHNENLQAWQCHHYQRKTQEQQLLKECHLGIFPNIPDLPDLCTCRDWVNEVGRGGRSSSSNHPSLPCLAF